MKLRKDKIDPIVLKNAENKLFNFWSSTVAGFIRDGCADPEKYSQAPVRLLFILKEVNGGSDWDLRDYMRIGCRAQTWDVIARWTEGIFHIDKDYMWAQMSKDNDQRRKKYVPQICAINMKKTSGSAVADSNAIFAAAERDKIWIKQQIELYHADVIILCGTEKVYQMVVDNSPKWKMTSRGIWYYVDQNGSITISFSHPEARTKQCFLYYGLIEAVKEILSTV